MTHVKIELEEFVTEFYQTEPARSISEMFGVSVQKVGQTIRR
jgi:hypothetical protein